MPKLKHLIYGYKNNPTHRNKFLQKYFSPRSQQKQNHTFKALRSQLQQTNSERDDLQSKLKQHEEEETTLAPWQDLLGFDTIENPGYTIKITMHNLAPPISIFQYYQAYKPMILISSNLPDIRTKTHLSKEQFQLLWNKATSTTRDLLVFMWVLKDLLIPRGVVELITANAPFYITRFCTLALAHIQQAS